MDSIIQPPRITSLNPRPLRIIIHTGLTTTESVVFPVVFPTETILQIKQRIAANKGGGNTWAAKYQFLATSSADQYKPADARWPFPTVRDPLLKTIDSRLFSDGERKIGNPVLLPALLVEDIFDEDRVLHCWNLQTIYGSAKTPPSGEEFIGFYQLYFPHIITVQDLMKGMEEGSDDRTMVQDYVATQQAKLDLLEAVLKEMPPKQAVLHDLRQIAYELPAKDIGSLELLFYNTTASSAIPFLRYFPSHARVAPLVKQYGPAVADKKLFETLMYDQPSAATAVLLMKVPITPRAPFGVAWTLRVTPLQAEVSMGAPRRDMPLKQETVRRAYEQLGPFLNASRVFAAATSVLSTLTATYTITSPLVEKPTKRDWTIRLQPFLALFHSDAIIRGDKAAFSLRYKAVSNYRPDTDPIQAYLTMLFLRDSTMSDATIPVASYMSSLISEFGITSQDATKYVSRWVENDSKAVAEVKTGSEAERERYIKLHPMGVSVSLYNNHPHYLVDIKGCDSEASLQHILSLMSALVLLPTERFAATAETVTATAAAAVADERAALEEAIPATGEALPATGEESAMWNMLNFGEGGELYEEEATAAATDVAATASATASDAAATASATAAATSISAMALPLKLSEGETIQPISDKWYISQYRTYDNDLFDLPRFSEGATVKPYSSHCQANGHQQPNIMTPEEYVRARTLYGNSVFWLETPPALGLQMALKCADDSPADRLKNFAGKPETQSDVAKILDMEALALSHGFPLHSGKSITDVKKVAKYVTDEQRKRIADLEESRKGKDLWVVARAGTKPIPNYYICAELWCVRDTLPLIVSEYRGTAWHDRSAKGAKKPNTCPFCGGSAIEKRKGGQVLPGETVIVRKERTTGLVAKFAGFFKDINYHPLHYALPCCFTTTASMLPPSGAVYPALVEEEEIAEVVVEGDEDRNRRRPFSQKSADSVLKRNPWYIPTQTVVGRNRERAWIDLERGGVAVPPAAVNQLLGQDPDVFLTKKRGVGDAINTHLATNATAFVRYGLEHSPRNPGVQFESLLCYADYACRILTDPSAVIETPSERLDFLLGEVGATVETEHTVAMIRGLEQAGYGTLLHEMSKEGEVADDVLGRWCKQLGIAFDSATNKAESRVLYLAWQNFKTYTRAKAVPKELRLWDSLLACPGLLTPTGAILVVIRVPKQKPDVKSRATFQCPSMGVAFSQQRDPPPFLFLMMDEETGQYDPLILYESKREAGPARGGAGGAGSENDYVVTNELLGALHKSASFARLSPTTKDVLVAFFAEYTNNRQGCGRAVPPVHPWMPVSPPGLPPIPVASDLKGLSLKPRFLLRDRSNRLVGTVVEFRRSLVYVPLLDDGVIYTALPSQRGETELPYTDIVDLLEAYGMALAPRYPGLAPMVLITDPENKRFVALRLACGVTVPCEPFLRTRSVDHPLFAELEKRGFDPALHEMPWHTDSQLLRPEIKGEPDLLASTSEEILSESYELLRLSFSRWLVEHADLAEQIERLRRSKRNLPIWEVQKRLEYLLTPLVYRFVTTEGEPAVAHRDVLRRDCLVTPQTECGGGCAWVSSAATAAATATGSQCLIHTQATPRYKNPLRLLTVRLTDELLQTFDLAEELLHNRVSAIKPLDPSTILPLAGDSVLFSAVGSSTSELTSRLGYDQRKPTGYTRGLTYPEEIGSEPELPADYGSLKPVSLGAAIARDKRAAAIAVLTGYLGITIQALQSELDRPWTSSTKDWQFIAEKRGVGVILHDADQAIQVVRPAAGALRFILVTDDGLLFRDTGRYEIPLPELPPSVRMQLS
jgi:hypothetical protein